MELLFGRNLAVSLLHLAKPREEYGVPAWVSAWIFGAAGGSSLCIYKILDLESRIEGLTWSSSLFRAVSFIVKGLAETGGVLWPAAMGSFCSSETSPGHQGTCARQCLRRPPWPCCCCWGKVYVRGCMSAGFPPTPQFFHS